ncbi:pitrilysin family protein [Clostridium sp.]|uniref:M16 family metallopeptidase n=1 Tax=Clostridium sp. TaxID=1506 RepID=UPI003216D549
MKKIRLSNGIKILYEKVLGNITSFTIGFEAGANTDNENKLGIAHAVEHMVFKGTNSKTEKEINDLCNEYLGFHNAMTNYPYVVYYGSCLKEDFSNGFNLYCDIVFNPAFKEDGFKEEISVILEELKEWSDDVVQHCEDVLFYNSFEKRRIKELIIGKEETIKSITLEDIKEFHKSFYTADNCVISVVTSLEIEEVLKIINGSSELVCVNKKVESEVLGTAGATYEERDKNNLGDLNKSVQLTYDSDNSNKDNKYSDILPEKDKFPSYENPKDGVFIEENTTINGCKLQYIFPIHELSEREVTLLNLFNEYFADGTSSILYDEIRTKRGLVYDIQGKVKNEKGIKLYTITLSTSKDNLLQVQEIIKENIERIKQSKGIFIEKFFRKYERSQNLKRMLALEKSIVLSMHLAVYEIMYGKCELLLEEFYNLNSCNEEEMIYTINKVFNNETLGIISN